MGDYPSGSDPMEDALSGLALDIWRRVVIAGEHLHLVAVGVDVVVVPVADYDAMTAALDAPPPVQGSEE